MKLYYVFSVEGDIEGILKIGQYLMKLYDKKSVAYFFTQVTVQQKNQYER